MPEALDHALMRTLGLDITTVMAETITEARERILIPTGTFLNIKALIRPLVSKE